ncbi:MAG TPA: hypothetical protein EYH04_05100 [Archaeoglobus profundus]|nr:hypothetical protein [Archaeoglobus profundus]
MDLLQLEFDVRYINVMSRKNLKEHALIRLIISALATPEELENLVKKDVRVINRNGTPIHTVKLTSGGKSRVVPIDAKTYDVVMKICKDKGSRQRIFDYTREEMDKIVEKYSPIRRKYNVMKLRSAVIEILKDCLFSDHDYVNDILSGSNFNGIVDFLYDFHPMFSGMWDIDDDEAAEDFIMNYTAMTGIRDIKIIAKEIGESEERIARLMKKLKN